MITYTRVKLENKKRLTLQIIAENATWLQGWESDQEGGRNHHMHLIDKATIVTRQAMKMNLHYGWLERE